MATVEKLPEGGRAPGTRRRRPGRRVARPQIDAREVALLVLATLAVGLALSAARDVLIPLVLGVLLSYVLEPLVSGLTRWRVPRAAAAGALLLVLIGGGTLGTYQLSDDAGALFNRLPEAAQKFRRSLRRGPENALDQVQRLASEIERSAAEAAGSTPAPPGVTRVQVEQKPIDVQAFLRSGSMGMVGLLGQALLLSFLVFFLLASGDLYKRKLVRIMGPSFGRQRTTVEVLGEIELQVQRFLLVQIVTSAVVGVASWLAFRALGLEQAAVWGIAAGVLNSIPYFGPLVIMAGVALVAFLQFGTVAMAVLLAVVSFAITTLEGFLLTPWLVGRTARMNQVAVFAGLMFWGWLWGVAGMLLAVPMLVVTKAVCDRVRGLQPIGELLGE
jgi:predicted PurR-regulated permease PerM